MGRGQSESWVDGLIDRPIVVEAPGTGAALLACLLLREATASKPTGWLRPDLTAPTGRWLACGGSHVDPIASLPWESGPIRALPAACSAQQQHPVAPMPYRGRLSRISCDPQFNPKAIERGATQSRVGWRPRGPWVVWELCLGPLDPESGSGRPVRGAQRPGSKRGSQQRGGPNDPRSKLSLLRLCLLPTQTGARKYLSERTWAGRSAPVFPPSIDCSCFVLKPTYLVAVHT